MSLSETVKSIQTAVLLLRNESKLPASLWQSLRAQAAAVEQAVSSGWKDLDAIYWLGWFYWYSWAVCSQVHDGDADRRKALDLFCGYVVFGGTRPSPEPLEDEMADTLIPYAFDVFERAAANPVSKEVMRAHTLLRRTLSLCSDRHPDRPALLANIAIMLTAKYTLDGLPEDIDDAIVAARQAVESSAAHDSQRYKRLSILATALDLKCEHDGASTDLDEAIDALREAIHNTPSEDGYRATRMFRFAAMLERRFRLIHASSDLDEAITAYEVANEFAATEAANEPPRLGLLAGLYIDRFELRKNESDLDTAIDTYVKAAATSVDGGHRSALLSILANSLHRRFLLEGDLEDLNAAISTLESAIAAAEDARAKCAACHSLLGRVLWERFDRGAVWSDLDSSIHQCELAVAHSDPGDEDLWSRLDSLSNHLRERYRHSRASYDLDRAVSIAELAVGQVPDEPRFGDVWNTLAGALIDRSGRDHRLSDLDRAIEVLGTLADATPVGEERRAQRLMNLANALKQRYEKTGNAHDLVAAVRAAREAFGLTSQTNATRDVMLKNLGGILWRAARDSGDMAQWQEAIDLLRDAAESSSPGRERCTAFWNLAVALRSRHELTGTPSDGLNAVAAFRSAARIDEGPVYLRIQAAAEAAHLSALSDPGGAADLLAYAVDLLPQLVSLRLLRADQQEVLADLSPVATDAAALCLSRNDTSAEDRGARALQLIEAGRASILAQMLDIRSDVSDLQLEHPNLAARFLELGAELNQSVDVADPQPVSAAPFGEQAWTESSLPTRQDRTHIAKRFSELLAEIRGINGFESFALPPSVDGLRREARRGPVVTLNVSSYRSDALILVADGVIPLSLPDLATHELVKRINRFYDDLNEAASPTASLMAQMHAERRIHDTLGWLWDVAVDPVLSALGYCTAPSSLERWPRVWWSPGGLLGLLPLHAAGWHDGKPASCGRSALDRVVSSYTPTVRALSYARRKSDKMPLDARSIVVGMPTTPGLPNFGKLPHAVAEVEVVSRSVPEPLILRAGVDSPWESSFELPTRKRVLERLSVSAVAHFACHATTHPRDPSKSLLLLSDHQQYPLDVGALASTISEDARLAYLSACSTALTQASDLLDQAIHLTSSFQLAGFSHVIGTLWTVNDKIAGSMASSFYDGITTSNGLDPSRSAYALSAAVRACRDQLIERPSLWAAYLHAGA